jgi:uncharacterized protein with von Willebrand factor type A (vWA) domain
VNEIAPLSRPLADFIRALRAHDVQVSPAEAIDAHEALIEVGFDDRELVRDALMASLAKSANEAARFETCFDAFFARDGFANWAGERGESRPGGLAELLLSGDAAALAEAMEAAAERAGAGAIQLSAQRGLMVRRVLDEMGLRGVEARIGALRQAGEEGETERLAEARERLFDEARAFVGRQERLYASLSGRRLRDRVLARQSFAAIAADDVMAMEALVRRMAKKLAERYARRRHRARVGQLDVRRTIRRSLAYDGTPFDLTWKQRRIERPRIVVACDVSRSVAAAAQFLLLFLYCLKDVVGRLDACAFSDRLVAVDDLLTEETVDEAIPLILERIGFRPTNYGRALEDLFAIHGERLSRRTTVIILGDGRSNFAEPRLDLMRRLAAQTRQVIWLNPEPRAYWGQGDSRMDAYSRFCRVARTCNTLVGLERIIEEALAAYAGHS